MLIDLHYTSTEPLGIFAVLAQVNKPHAGEKPFAHLAKGVYRTDNYRFNGDSFIEINCDESVLEEIAYGVCDSYQQVMEMYPELITDADHKYVILLSSVYKSDQPSEGGWRWHKWGPYIGTQNSTCEYLYDEPDVEKVYCYKICEVD